MRGAILLALTALLLTSTIVAFCDSLDDRISVLLKDLEYLNSKGVDVSKVVKDLNAVVKLYEANRIEEAMSLLNNVSLEVKVLKSQAENVYLRNAVVRYGAIAFTLSIPVIAYFAIPRIYLYIWFKLHRSWIVERRRGRK